MLQEVEKLEGALSIYSVGSGEVDAPVVECLLTWGAFIAVAGDVDTAGDKYVNMLSLVLADELTVEAVGSIPQMLTAVVEGGKRAPLNIITPLFIKNLLVEVSARRELNSI